MNATAPNPQNEAAAIQALNDTLRQTGVGGRTVLTAGIASLPTESLTAALRAVAAFDAFTPDNDPYGEHDCATVETSGIKVIWKIDYYDPETGRHSDDPTNPAITNRLLTIMLAEEY
jgi:hypothetical protein